ncbi:MAG: isoaspartyl peptidase/L-asparaginase [Planctomycetota bacterium]
MRTPSSIFAPVGHAAALAALALLPACASAPNQSAASRDAALVSPAGQTLDLADDVVLIVHGGAGTLDRAEMPAELEAEYRATLEAALRAGHAALQGGGAPEDAVIAAIRILEDSPLFNAGRGAVLTHEGRHELDASLMVGSGRDGVAAGAVAGVTTVRHPIELARAVLERTPHVLLAGAGADRFAADLGLELVPNGWFTTEKRRQALERALADEARTAAGSAAAPRAYLGTVGCVARDGAGRLAAGTSTGGMTNKRFGRVGDSPIIGAGTWADDRTVGVSCTGHGEFFLRGAVAHDVHARMLHAGQDVGAASAGTLAELTERGGEGGWIALTPAGRAAAPFNSSGMYRGWIDSKGRVTVRIWGE